MSRTTKLRSVLSPFATRCGLVIVVVASAWCAGCEDPCCARDSDCAAAAKCFEGSCRLACDDKSQCLSGQTCNPQGVCVGVETREQYCGFEFKGSAPLGGFEPEASPEPEPVVEPEPGPAPEPEPEPGVQPGCPDGYEPNDAINQAPTMPAAGGAEICADDIDYFQIDIPDSASATVTVTFDAPAVDIDLRLLNVDGQEVDIATGIGDTEVVTGTREDGQTFFLEVSAFAGRIGPYNFVLSRAPLVEMCVDDALEPNQDPETATPYFEIGGPLDATICLSDSDVFVFSPLGPPSLALVTLEPLDGPNPAVQFEKVDDSGWNTTGSLTNGAAQMLVRLDVFSYLTVFESGVGPGGARYRIRDEPYAVLCPDEFEPNDEVPVEVSVPVDARLSMCGDDIDLFFPFGFEGNDVITVTFDSPLSPPNSLLAVLARRVGGPQDFEIVEELSPGQSASMPVGDLAFGDVLVGVVRPGGFTELDLEYRLQLE